jgi:hypothetical protein
MDKKKGTQRKNKNETRIKSERKRKRQGNEKKEGKNWRHVKADKTEETTGGRNYVREIVATVYVFESRRHDLWLYQRPVCSLSGSSSREGRMFLFSTVASGCRRLSVPTCSANGMFAPDMRCGLLRQCASRLRAIRHSRATCLLLRVGRPSPRTM